MRAMDLAGDFMPDPGMDPTAGFSGLFAAFGVIFVIVLVFGIVIGIRKYRILHDAGVDPFTVDAAVAAKVLRSDVLASSEDRTRPIEVRLAELDDLLARGVISADEHRDARAAVLRG